MVPSLPLLLVCPLIVRPATMIVRPAADAERALRRRVAARFARIAASGICSIRPGAEHRRRNAEDHVAVARAAVAKSGCASVQPAAPARPGDGEQRVDAAVGRAVAVPDEPRFAHRAVRVMNDGTVSPPLFANATCGFTAGLVPPLRAASGSRRSYRDSSAARCRRRSPRPRRNLPSRR